MRTKRKPGGSATIEHVQVEKTFGPHGLVSLTDNAATVTYGDNVITYSTLPPLYGHVFPWQECNHRCVRAGNPVSANLGWSYQWIYENPGWHREKSFKLIDGASLAAAPSGEWDPSCINGILDQLDLNSRENVLLYSGVIQAIPLLGSVFKLNAILRKIIRNTSKSFRRKPFTTVIKSLISADFIDRFVISPTLDDARRFQDACDYTLRVLQTAHDRNEHRFALRSKIKILLDEATETRRFENGTVYRASVTYRTQKYIESQAFMLLEARYNMTAVAPLKVWAQRVGLTRPLESIWDLVPFSFVADYFFRGGDFISHLSDEMSRVDGLQGKIAKIYDLWGSVNCTTERRAMSARLDRVNDLPYGAEWIARPSIECTHSVLRSTNYSRFRVTDNPWQYISSLSRSENWGALNLSLRATQKRTLAELFIQAKLKS